jgi:hypothetical protein
MDVIVDSAPCSNGCIALAGELGSPTTLLEQESPHGFLLTVRCFGCISKIIGVALEYWPKIR